LSGPIQGSHTTHRLYRNNGNGTFTDVSASAEVSAAPPAAGLGVVMNDMRPAYLFINRGGGRFEEKGVTSGCALDAFVRHLAGMGVAANDRRLLIGLGKAPQADRVTVHWPSGRRQQFGPLPARSGWRLHEGRERPEAVVASKKG
jgi:hypothetical protein